MSLELIHPESPRLAVDWRWRLASSLRGAAAATGRGWADPWVDRAVARQDAQEVADSDCRAIGADESLARALRLRDGGNRRRWEVEARLLAAEGDDAIARKCCMPAGAVAAFAAVFFDVRPRLDRAGYIQHQAINPPVDASEPPAGRAWRALGYGGGPLVVDFLAAAGEAEFAADGSFAVGPAAPRGRDARLRRLVAASLALDLDAAAALRMLPLIASLDESGFGSAPATGLAPTLAGLDLAAVLSSDEGCEGARGGPGSPARRPGGGLVRECHEGGEPAPLRRFGS
ncbi:hypothetical protein [Paludisphaera soli]|uniref:hypothetical protein n=1 Tax=Paludisphaera soli TaxID=2712865 RepID=UPI0013EB20A0|nr:hypothetical protein [Paludisphaera soli]